MGKVNLKLTFDPECPFGSDPWDEAFVYLDEQHANPTDPSFAVGLLMTPTQVPPALCAEAIGRLPSTNRASVRGFFHAVDDGKEAQTSFADAIGKHLTSAEFFAFRWSSAKEPERVRPDDELHMQVAALVLDHARSVVRGHIHIEYASGPTISLAPFAEWLNENEEVRLQSFVRSGGKLPARFPPFSVREGRPEASAGLQVADALLWNHRRVRAGKRSKLPCKDFFERTVFRETARWNEESGPMEKWSYCRAAPAPLARRPFGRTPDDWNGFGSLVIGIEKAVHDVARLRSAPPHVAHLMSRVRAASDALRDQPSVSPESQQEALRVFLMLVDTFPLYDETAATQQVAADAAGVASSMFDPRDPGTVMRLDRWADYRTSATPAVLGWRVH